MNRQLESWGRPRRTEDIPGLRGEDGTVYPLLTAEQRLSEPLSRGERDLLAWSTPELLDLLKTRPGLGRRFWQGLALAVPLALAIWGLLMLGIAVIGAVLGLWSHPAEWFK